MAITSSKVAAGMTILADQFNKLWADLTANHDHSSGQGGTVDHANLADTGDMSGFTHNHDDLEVHLNGSGDGSQVDNPGGDMGVHGLAASSYVCGSLGQISDGSDLSQGQLTIMTGYVTVGSDNSGDVLFTPIVAFSTAPHIVIGSVSDAVNEGDSHKQICVHTVTTSGFSWVVDGGQTRTGFYWMAVGTKA